MLNNYGLFLLLATIVMGLVVLIDARYFKKQRISASKKQPLIIDFSRTFFPIILIILLVRSFLYEPFRIPSDSMQPTLMSGDLILVEKFSYGLRMPGFHQLLLETSHPKTGDVAVFRFPIDGSEIFIKRIVGLPGDKITYINKTITIERESHDDRYVEDHCIEGKPVGSHCKNKRIIKQELLDDGTFFAADRRLLKFQENLGTGWHNILIDPKKNDMLEINQWVVPQGHYFVMGDNRDNSNDSRYWGFVSEQDFVGKAVIVWLHFKFENNLFSWLPSDISFKNVRLIH